MSQALSTSPADESSRETLRRASADLDIAETLGRPHGMAQALAAVGRAYAALEAWPSAEACQVSALRWARCGGGTDAVVELLCELSETAVRVAHWQASSGDTVAARAARERARDAAFEASQLASRVADPSWEVQVLLRISDVLDRCGDRDDAVLLQTRALRLMSGVAGAGALPDPHVMPGIGRLADS